jgi:hypothetical protein
MFETHHLNAVAPAGNPEISKASNGKDVVLHMPIFTGQHLEETLHLTMSAKTAETLLETLALAQTEKMF